MKKLKLKHKANSVINEITIKNRRKEICDFLEIGAMGKIREFYGASMWQGKRVNLNPGSFRENSTEMICPHPYWQRTLGTGMIVFFTGKNHWEYFPIVFRGKNIIGTTSQSFFKAKKSLGPRPNRFSRQKNHWDHVPIVFRSKKIIGTTSQSFFGAKKSLGPRPNHFLRQKNGPDTHFKKNVKKKLNKEKYNERIGSE